MKKQKSELRNGANLKQCIILLGALTIMLNESNTMGVQAGAPLEVESYAENVEITTECNSENEDSTENNSDTESQNQEQLLEKQKEIINNQMNSIANQASLIVEIENYYEANRELKVVEQKMENLMNLQQNILVDSEEKENADKKIRLAKEYVYQLETTEIHMLAKGIHGEAGICDTDEKYRVGTVIMNRVEHEKFANDVESVLEEGYSCYMNDQWFSEEPTGEEYEIAKDILLNGTRSWDNKNIVFQSKKCCGTKVDESKWHEYGAL